MAPHADERMVADGTAVHDRGMTDGHVMADDRGRVVAHVQAGALLHVRALAQPHEAVAVTPDGRVEQDAALVADGDVADDGRVGRHMRGGGDGGGFVRLLHGHPLWMRSCVNMRCCSIWQNTTNYGEVLPQHDDAVMQCGITVNDHSEKALPSWQRCHARHVAEPPQRVRY